MVKHEWIDNDDGFYATEEGIFQRYHDREGFKWEEEVFGGDVGIERSLGFAAREILRLAEENAALRLERDGLLPRSHLGSPLPTLNAIWERTIEKAKQDERSRLLAHLRPFNSSDEMIPWGCVVAVLAQGNSVEVHGPTPSSRASEPQVGRSGSAPRD